MDASWWRPHVLPDLDWDRRGHAGRWITNAALDHSSIRAACFAKLEFLSPGCTWQCRNLSPSYRQFSFVPKVQLSLLQLFRRFSVKSEPASVSRSQQPPSFLEVPEGSIPTVRLKTVSQRSERAECGWLSSALWLHLLLLMLFEGKLVLLKGSGITWYCWLCREYAYWPQSKGPFLRSKFMPSAQ